jgi:hypothetical protein
MEHANLNEIYFSRAEANSLLCSKEKKILLILSLTRLLVFVGGFGLTIFCFSFSVIAGILLLSISVSLFLFLLNRFVFHSEKRDFYTNLETINKNEIKALSDDLSPFENGSNWIDTDHDFSNDIDLFGDNSLFHFLNRTISGYGRNSLAGWLSEPYCLSAELQKRQNAISELASKLDWRQEFMAKGLGKSINKEDIDGLLGWVNEKSGFFLSFFTRTIIWVSPILAITSIVLVLSGLVPYSIFIILFIFNLSVVAGKLQETNKIHLKVSKKHEFLISLSRLLSSFEKETFKAEILIDYRQKFYGGELSAVRSIVKLNRIIQSFDSRLNFIVGFALNGLLLWDLHCIRSLEKWKDEARDQFPGWLDRLGELDAYLSLANFTFNNPVYAFPRLSESGEVFTASEMGHPLISASKRVCNDFSISDIGSVFIITGANMSGKSTFLRTLAVNYILAMTGAPVCAQKMNFTPLKLFTSMRTTDSLTQNESYFYAELRRLKTLKTKLEDGEKLLFILDEILKGTNSLDKSTGSKLFMRKIVELGGTGLIATHDTSLGDMETEFHGRIKNKCFEIEINGENISFDYKLQEGITRKMNAALLMIQMGIV